MHGAVGTFPCNFPWKEPASLWLSRSEAQSPPSQVFHIEWSTPGLLSLRLLGRGLVVSCGCKQQTPWLVCKEQACSESISEIQNGSEVSERGPNQEGQAATTSAKVTHKRHSDIEKNETMPFATSLVAQMLKASAYKTGDPGSIPRWGRYPGERNGNPLQYSCLENPMEPTVPGIVNGQT